MSVPYVVTAIALVAVIVGIVRERLLFALLCALVALAALLGVR